MAAIRQELEAGNLAYPDGDDAVAFLLQGHAAVVISFGTPLSARGSARGVIARREGIATRQTERCEQQQYPHVALSDQSHHSRWEICECSHHNKPDITEKEFVTSIHHRVFNHLQSFCVKRREKPISIARNDAGFAPDSGMRDLSLDVRLKS
jgi:hypothetical protein